MPQEEQGDILAGVRERRCEAKQRRDCHLIKADDIVEKLLEVAKALPKGLKGDHKLMLETPSVDTISTLHRYIRDENETIAKCDEQLDR